MKIELSEYWAVIKYLTEKQLNTGDIHDELVNTLSDSDPSYPTVKKWYHEFKLGREAYDDALRSDGPSTVTSNENIDRI